MTRQVDYDYSKIPRSDTRVFMSKSKDTFNRGDSFDKTGFEVQKKFSPSPLLGLNRDRAITSDGYTYDFQKPRFRNMSEVISFENDRFGKIIRLNTDILSKKFRINYRDPSTGLAISKVIDLHEAMGSAWKTVEVIRTLMSKFSAHIKEPMVGRPFAREDMPMAMREFTDDPMLDRPRRPPRFGLDGEFLEESDLSGGEESIIEFEEEKGDTPFGPEPPSQSAETSSGIFSTISKTFTFASSAAAEEEPGDISEAENIISILVSQIILGARGASDQLVTVDQKEFSAIGKDDVRAASRALLAHVKWSSELGLIQNAVTRKVADVVDHHNLGIRSELGPQSFRNRKGDWSSQKISKMFLYFMLILKIPEPTKAMGIITTSKFKKYSMPTDLDELRKEWFSKVY